MVKKTKKITLKTTEKRNTALHNVMREINKKLGNDAIKLAKDEKIKDRISFGVESIDNFTGNGTVRGNFCIIYGGDSTGKTSLAYSQIATNQKKGLVCAYFDLEHSFDVTRAKNFGIDLNKLVLIEKLSTAEQAMNILIRLCKEKVIDYAVIDSIQAMSPKGQQENKKGAEKSVEDDNIALLARKMSQFLVMSKDTVYVSNVGVLMIGQVRTGGIGSFVTTSALTGGLAQKHYSLMTLFMRKGQKADAPREKYITETVDNDGKTHKRTKERIIGFDCVVKVIKKKIINCQNEGSELHLPFYFETGFTHQEKIEDNNDKRKEEIK